VFRTSKRAIHKIFSAFGYRIVPIKAYRPTWDLEHFFPLLQKFGFAPKNIWDVGANHGDWTRQALRYFPDCSFTLMEPQNLKHNVQDLIDHGDKIFWIGAGAGDQSGTMSFHLCPSDESSTLVPRTDQDTIGHLEIPVMTLNEVLLRFRLAVPELLKIDAEGFDLRVLEGATDLLGKTEIVLVEAAVGQRDFENTASTVIQAMDRHGYRLIDITDINRSSSHGVLWLCELAFLRKSSNLLLSASKY
jgi:FkbM family methyltransferase